MASATATTTRRCFRACLQTANRAEGARVGTLGSRRFPVSSRGYGQAAFQRQGEPEGASHAYQQHQHQRSPRARDDGEGSSSRDDYDARPLADHLDQLFPPLTFPPALAHRVLTHASHQTAKHHGNNTALNFIGRRVLHAYLNLFLSASTALKPSHDLAALAEHTLNPKLLGEHIGSAQWGFEKVLQWTPAVSRQELEAARDMDTAWRRIGFYKVQGDAVAATIGAVFQQYGGEVAHRLFHTQVLPHLLVPGGLSREFEKDVETICQRMGGRNASLLRKSPSSPRREAPPFASSSPSS